MEHTKIMFFRINYEEFEDFGPNCFVTIESNNRIASLHIDYYNDKIFYTEFNAEGYVSGYREEDWDGNIIEEKGSLK